MIALVMPVFGRVALVRIVLAQRAHLVRVLAGLGVDAEVVVVGDDENLDTAREHGFHVVEAPNPLGRRINDGFEYAYRELGARHAVFNGSDSWLLPEVLADTPGPGLVRTSRELSLCSGRFLVHVPNRGPVGRAPWTIDRALMEPHGFRPVPDDRPRGLDGALRDAIRKVNPDAFVCPIAGDDPLRVVDFRRGPWEEQLTPWERIVPKGARRYLPWEALAERYPIELVQRMERFYAEGA